MNNASKTLQKIMEDKDYARRLEYKHHAEFGLLVAFCNRLLGMVNRHTAELQTLSLTDPLTDLGNRRAFDTQSKKFWALAERSKSRMALIAFDIDYFKSYNDRYGHPAGDKVIQAFARILEHTFKRASDVVDRVRGEKFLVVTHDTTEGACLVQADKVLQELSELRVEHIDNPAACLTACAGIFQETPDANLSLEIAVASADAILYMAKKKFAIRPCTASHR
jgi:diguanylate cyclase (GGDEF)-like protein